MKLLFIGYGGGHMRLLHQIAFKVVSEKDIDLKIIALTTGYLDIQNFYNSNILKKPSDYSFLFDNDIAQINKYGSMLLDENHNPNSGLDIEDSRFYLGMSYYDLVLEYGENKAKEIYKQKKRHAFLPKRSMRKILEFESPDMLIATTSPKCELASLIEAKRLGIKTMQIIDLFGDNFPTPFADSIIVMNNNVKKKLDSRIDLNSRVYAYGQPVFDYTIKSVSEVNRYEVRKKLKLEKDKLVILFSPSRYLLYSNDKSIEKELDHDLVNKPVFDLFDRLNKKKNIKVVIRPHPNDDPQKFSKYLVGKNYIKLLNNKHYSLYESIAISDFVVAYNSTILIESTLCGKIAFPFNYDSNQTYHWPELTREPFEYSSNFDNLEKNLTKAIERTELNLSIKKDISNFYKRGSVDKILRLIKRN